MGEVLPVKQNAAVRGLEYAGEKAKERGFARAIGTYYTQKLVSLDLEAGVGDYDIPVCAVAQPRYFYARIQLRYPSIWALALLVLPSFFNRPSLP